MRPGALATCRAGTRGIAAFVCAWVAGCATEPLPTFPDLNTPDAIRVASERAIEPPIRASGTVTLTRSDANSVTLDAALVARGNSEARLRAWKFGRAVFDLTLTPEGLWVFSDRDESAEEEPPRGPEHAEFSMLWRMLRGDFFGGAPELVSENASSLVLERTIGGSRVRCVLDRPTLTARSYDVHGAVGTRIGRLELSRYRLVNGVPIASRFVGTAGSGSIEVNLDDVEFDPEVPDSVFVPPARAVRQP